ncbi:MAG TPA: hypothetical protein VK808_01320, partial [Bacteroidia bacterium]|nr:hypothetical protein [Bacteroidia bacterium]
MKKVLGIIALLLISCYSYATHEVGGYISLKCMGGYTYQATITTYTNTYLTTADRDTMRIWWGDGQYDVLTRVNGPIDANGFPGGEPICNYDFSQTPPQVLEDARKINIYIGTHTYTGPANYKLWMDDPDRMAYIDNITNSVNVDFYLQTILCISPFTGCVNTPLITNEPVCQYGCTGQCYTYNPGAYIPQPPSDGDDSIEYVLGNSLVLGDQVAPGYVIPPGTTLDPHTGTLQWCSTQQGKWNFVILMVTWCRTYIDGAKLILPVDTEELELEVIINTACNPPKVSSVDTCVVAGGTANLTFSANNGNSGHLIYITDAGEPFSLSPPAILTHYNPGFSVAPQFDWQTNCPEVRDNPYEVVIEATEKIAQGSGFPPDTAYYRAYGT